MFKMATLPDHQTPKKDLVHCDNCGTPMTIVGANYVCLVNAEGGPDRCTTTSVDAESLVVQAVTQVLNRVINYSTTDVLAADVQQTVSEESSTQQERLQISESSIEDLNRSKEQVLQRVEQNLTTYPEVAEVTQPDKCPQPGSGLRVPHSTRRDRQTRLHWRRGGTQTGRQRPGHPPRRRGARGNLGLAQHIRPGNPGQPRISRDLLFPPVAG